MNDPIQSPAQLPGTVTFNTIIYISVLEASERGSSRRIAEDVRPLTASEDGLHFHYFETESVENLGDYLGFVASRVRSHNWRPIIHIDGHGDAIKGLLVGRDEFVSWGELVTAFRVINLAARNNLIVVLGACEAFNLIKKVTLFDSAPFYALLAPEKVVSAGLLEERFRSFYTHLFAASDLTAARVRLGQEFGYFHAEKVLATTIARYLRDHGTGRGLARRTEDLLTQLLKIVDEKDKGHLGAHRAHVKRMTKPVQTANLMRLIEQFLFDRSMALSLDDLMEMARQSNLPPRARH